jgi:hypothetical protein
MFQQVVARMGGGEHQRERKERHQEISKFHNIKSWFDSNRADRERPSSIGTQRKYLRDLKGSRDTVG